MQKIKEEHKRGNMKAYFLIANLIIATFAFSWLVGATITETVEDGVAYYFDTENNKKYSASEAVIIKNINNGQVTYYNSETGNTYTTPAVSNTPASAPPSQPGGGNKPPSKTLTEDGATLFSGGSVVTGAMKGGGTNSWIVPTADGNVLVKNIAKDSIKDGTKGTLLNTGQEYQLKGINTEGIKQATQMQSTYGPDWVTLSNGQSMSKLDILQSTDPKVYNDANALKSFNAESITKSDGKTIIKGPGGAQTTIDPSANNGLGSITSQGKGTTYLSQIFGQARGTFGDAALSGLEWAGIAFAVGQAIGGLAGMDTSQTMGLSAGLSAGVFTYKFIKTSEVAKAAFAKFPLGPVGAGLVVGGIVFALMYKKESKEVVSFTCKPWQAPVGGADCEKCNDKAGCSEYRCRSLGQACKLLNVGTTQERCAWVNPKDVKSPGISPWEDVLTKGYKYTDVRIRPPGEGSEPGRMRIVREGAADGCVEAFTPLEFGITTTGPDGEDEPAICKIDYNHTLKFDNMAYDFGESNIYSYNHSQKLALPSPAALNAAALELKNDGTYSLYVRCQDANGNENVDEFVISFCVDKTEDTTAPKIEGTSIANNMPVKYNQSTVDLDVYVNEPADCRWSRDNKGYDIMENQMKCNNKVWEMNNNMVYTCKTNLTGIKDRKENVFYFRCKDNPNLNESKRNPMRQSHIFTLIGTEPLNIIDVSPNNTIVRGSTSVVSVNLEVETANGYKNGEAICYYNEQKRESGWVEFFETGTSKHKQRLDLNEGVYKYYIKCVDLGGNRDDSYVEFTVDVDTESPAIVRVYEENQLLKIITDEASTCKYSTQSCNFLFEDGVDMPYANETSHVAEWKTENTYYIRCSDNYGNIPVSNTCSMIVRPYDVVQQKVKDG